jgi:hypothetical protein
MEETLTLSEGTLDGVFTLEQANAKLEKVKAAREKLKQK